MDRIKIEIKRPGRGPGLRKEEIGLVFNKTDQNSKI